MGYIKAKEILPRELIEEIQKYVDSEMIYIPRKESKRKNWGDKTNTKEVLTKRNYHIYQDYQAGMSISKLVDKYFLVDKSIQRILRKYQK
ncbi:MAG: CD3324 family protein [Coprobacillaceae bacterium]